MTEQTGQTTGTAATPHNQYNQILSALLQHSKYKEARGMLLAAMMLALSDPEVPEAVIGNLVLTYCSSVDQEIAQLTTEASGRLAAIGLTQDKIVEIVNRYNSLNGVQTDGKPN